MSFHTIWLWAHLPAVATWTADGGALALGLDNVGGVGFGNAARCGCDLGSAGDDVGVVGLGLSNHSASLTPGGLGDSGVTGGDASVSSYVRLGRSDYSRASLDVIHQYGSGDDSRLGSF